jgi:RNA polymerase sigma-70 factor (ECF subfamily)
VSEWFDTTIASVNSSLQRARKTVDERLPEQSQQATLRSLGDERIRKLVEGYLVAWRNGDVDSLRALLTRDAVFSMPPWSSWWRGRDTIAGFAKTAVEECGETRSIPTRANAQLAIAYYHLDDATGRFTASALDVLTVAGPEIKDITAFVTPEIFPSFDLPTELTA